MRSLILKLVVCFLLAAAACALVLLRSSYAQQTGGKTHYILLDDSGSMKARYGNNLRGWLIESLLKSSAFSKNDRVLVRWFDHRENANFDANDQQLKYNAGFDPQAILNKVPTPAEAIGSDTDIPQALDLTLADLKNRSINDEVLIWLVTDNVEDVGGAGSVDPLYKKISEDKNFQSAYVFPLTNENGRQPPNGEAMVMYLLQYSGKPSRPNLDRYADDVGKKIGNPPITWFPIERGIELREGSISVDNAQAEMVDGRVKLPPVEEGATPEFTLKFPFYSNLRGLKIIESKITPQPTTPKLPDTVEAEGDINSWHAKIDPTDLKIDPGKKSEVIYETKLAGNMSLKPASFWNAVWNSTSEPVEISFDYKLDDVKTEMDTALLGQVKNLQSIQSNVRQSQKNVGRRSIPMSFVVEYHSLWRRLLVAVLGVLVIGMVAGGTSLLLSKSRYELSTPFGEQTLALPLIGSNHIAINGDRAAIIKNRFGTITIAPLGVYALDGKQQPRKLDIGLNNSFEIEDTSNNKRYIYSLRRLTTAGKESATRDDFLD
ncbi:MAG TPA: hypothetical protein VK619_06315 [Pyrinomonadaceae bacterium]|nr:hypothetical protein [Pyrinomonadaceae bacterium]